MSALRVGFAGTPGFAAEALSAILAAGFPVPLVLTQPDRPRGRGLLLAASPAKVLAVERRIPVFQPATLKPEAERATVLAVAIDVLVVAAYGLILPPAVLAWPRHGALNIHASLLPRWRGAAPIQRALLAGDRATGITIMQMEAGLDTGPIVSAIEVPIAPRDTTGTLTAKLAQTGAAAIVAALERMTRDRVLAATPQPAAGMTYAAKITRADAALDWALPAATLDRIVRALDPAPGAYTRWHGETLKVWAAEPLATVQADAPGTITSIGQDGIAVACGSGALRLVAVQPPGGKRMPAAAFAAGHGVALGVRFEPAAP